MLTVPWENTQGRSSFHQQSLDIFRQIGDRHGEASSLNGLGNAYGSLGEYPRAIDFYQQSLEIKRQIGYRSGEANSLSDLGIVYRSLGEYPRAIDFHQQSLEIFRQIGDRHGEASSLKNLAYALAKLDRPWEALQHYQKARQLYAKLELEHEVQDCDAVIYRLHGIIPAITHPAPTIGDPHPVPAVVVASGYVSSAGSGVCSGNCVESKLMENMAVVNRDSEAKPAYAG